MNKKKHCKRCRQIFLITRNPKQHYCSNPDCQRVRKNQWRKNMRHNDRDYRNNQRDANCRWFAHHLDYWKQYRESHPEYVRRNREKQHVRDEAKIRMQVQAIHLAKSDALFEESQVQSRIYQLIPVLAHNLAKSDALPSGTPSQSRIYQLIPVFAHNLAKSPPYSQIFREACMT